MFLSHSGTSDIVVWVPLCYVNKCILFSVVERYPKTAVVTFGHTLCQCWAESYEALGSAFFDNVSQIVLSAELQKRTAGFFHVFECLGGIHLAIIVK